MVQSRIQKVNDSKPKDRVQILELLGTGGNGKVYRGLWKGVTVAYKIVQLPPNKSKLEREQKKMAMETVISSSLRHPNVVQTFSYEIVPYEIGEGQVRWGRRGRGTVSLPPPSPFFLPLFLLAP